MIRDGDANRSVPARGEVRRRFPRGGGGGVGAPTAIAARIIDVGVMISIVGGRDGGQRGIMIGVVIVLLRLLPTHLRGVSLLLAVTIKIEEGGDDDGDGNEGHDDGDGDGATGAQAGLVGSADGGRAWQRGSVGRGRCG